VAAGPSWCCLLCVCVCRDCRLLDDWNKTNRKQTAVRHFNYKGAPIEKTPPSIIPPQKTDPLPNQPPAKKSPLPPTTLKNRPPSQFLPIPFQIDPFPQSEPQNRKKRFIRQRLRSAERIGIILVSTCPCHQAWLHLPKTDRMQRTICRKPTNCPKTRPNNTPQDPLGSQEGIIQCLLKCTSTSFLFCYLHSGRHQ
jgi:hypothetical protein